jgi:hypothetical protein
VLKSVLRSMENIAPGLPPDIAGKMVEKEKRKQEESNRFSRASNSRHSVGGFNTRPHYSSTPMVSLASAPAQSPASRSRLYYGPTDDPTIV